MIHIENVVPSHEPEFAADDVVPVMVDWSHDECLHLRQFSPDDQLVCDFRLDLYDGHLVGLTILNAPNVLGPPPAQVRNASEVMGVPVFCREGFSLNPDLSPTLKYVDGTGAISRYVNDVAAGVVLRAHDTVETWARSGALRFGMSASGGLVAVEVDRAALPANSELLA